MKKTSPPSNQMAFEGMGAEGEELMSEARLWTELNRFGMWAWWIRTAKADGDATGYISADAITHALRREFGIKMSNNMTPCFARIFLEGLSKAEYEKYRPMIKVGRSKVDTFTGVKL
ncbi:MAG: hypothetical protein RR505_08245 [Raoultibacter sp.]